MPARLLVSVAAALAGVVAAAAPASAQLPAGPLTAQGAAIVKNVALHNDSAGARLHDGYFYVTTERDLTIYDTSVPESPKEVGRLAFPPQALSNYYFAEEDPDTNGRILITSNLGAIEVIDVSDKRAPKLLAEVPGTDDFPAQHTISCVLDCTWAYGSEGTIIDLRDPAGPRVAGNWTTGREIDSFHDVTEVAPGIVLTSSQPMHLLDARTNPEQPTGLASVANEDKRFNHANLWPNAMRDELVLVGGESMGPDCAADIAAAFQVYDASDWTTTGTFDLLDEFRLDTGLLADGRMVDSTYCVHWFDTHPTYRNGGLVAIAWYEHGTRFLQVGRDGTVTEVGWFLPIGTSASAVYWVTDRIVYVTDYNRGLDVVRFTGDIVPGAPEDGPTAPAPPPATTATPDPDPASPPTTGSGVQGQGAASLARPRAIAAARRAATRALGSRARLHRQLGSALVFRPASVRRGAGRVRPVAVGCDGCRVRVRFTLGDRRLGSARRTVRGMRAFGVRVPRRARGAIRARVTVIDGAGRQTTTLRVPLR